METALRYEKSQKHIAALLESFKNSIACNDTEYNYQLFKVLESALTPYTKESFSLAIWASPIVDSKDARLMAIYTKRR